MNIIGIDPGVSGGIACIRSVVEDGGQWITTAHAMPKTERDIVDLLCEMSGNGPSHDVGKDWPANTVAVVEKVWLRPKDPSTVGRLIENFGFLKGALTALRIPFDVVPPGNWQRTFALVRKPKSSAKQKAQQLFPHLKVTNATFDALLIAEWGRRHFASPAPS